MPNLFKPGDRVRIKPGSSRGEFKGYDGLSGTIDRMFSLAHEARIPNPLVDLLFSLMHPETVWVVNVDGFGTKRIDGGLNTYNEASLESVAPTQTHEPGSWDNCAWKPPHLRNKA